MARHFDDDDDDDDVGGGEEEGVGGDSGDRCGTLSDKRARIGPPPPSLPAILRSVRKLQRHRASDVLVTLGARGLVLVRDAGARGGRSSSRGDGGGGGRRERGRGVLYQPPCPLPPGTRVVDETGAGDSYRAGFAAALLESCGGNFRNLVDVDDGALVRCMEFASAAGAFAVTREGAVPGIPSRDEVDGLLGTMSMGGARGAMPIVPKRWAIVCRLRWRSSPRGGGRRRRWPIPLPLRIAHQFQ